VRPVRIHGATRTDRDQARTRRAVKRRVVFFAELAKNAPTEMERLSRACDYLRAVAKTLPDKQTKQLAAAVARLAEQAEEGVFK
jgi:hypothetical protein